MQCQLQTASLPSPCHACDPAGFCHAFAISEPHSWTVDLVASRWGPDALNGGEQLKMLAPLGSLDRWCSFPPRVSDDWVACSCSPGAMSGPEHVWDLALGRGQYPPCHFDLMLIIGLWQPSTSYVSLLQMAAAKTAACGYIDLFEEELRLSSPEEAPLANRAELGCPRCYPCSGGSLAAAARAPRAHYRRLPQDACCLEFDLQFSAPPFVVLLRGVPLSGWKSSENSRIGLKCHMGCWRDSEGPRVRSCCFVSVGCASSFSRRTWCDLLRCDQFAFGDVSRRAVFFGLDYLMKRGFASAPMCGLGHHPHQHTKSTSRHARLHRVRRIKHGFGRWITFLDVLLDVTKAAASACFYVGHSSPSEGSDLYVLFESSHQHVRFLFGA